MIQTLAREYPIERLCQTLEVARSGYYQWRQRPLSRRMRQNQELLAHLQEAFAQSRQTYGSPRLTRLLQRQHIPCSENRVARLMRRHHLRAKSKRPFRPRTTQGRQNQRLAPNHLAQRPPATAVNQTWVADITYLQTQGGWIYLAAVMDLYSRKIVGWALGFSLQSSLVEEALRQALALRRPAPGLLHHSDRGIQYVSSAFQALLHSWQILPSMSATGHCYDNAHMESFWSTLKTELIQDLDLVDFVQARSALFDYIEVFYNRKRLHSALNYHSPVDFEQQSTYK
jgi:putative transposase